MRQGTGDAGLRAAAGGPADGGSSAADPVRPAGADGAPGSTPPPGGAPPAGRARPLRHLAYEATLDCVHCGLCLPHCPTYRESGRESSSPRGRIYLVRAFAEGRLEADRALAEELEYCLDCRACESACPAGVRYGRIVESARAELEARAVRGRLRRAARRAVLRGVFGSPLGLATLFGVARFAERTRLLALARRTGILRALPPLARAVEQLPPLGPRFRAPLVVPARGRRRGRVALFVGCVMPELLPSVHEATVEALVENGFEVTVPAGQRCCGALHVHAGDPVAAERLHRRNRAAFRLDAVDAIVTNSAGCGAALRERDDAFAAAVRDVAEFLVEAGFRPPRAPLEARVAYDDPCHLLHAQRIAEPPRRLLRAIPGLELVDLPGSSRCCGAAGLYAFTHPATAERLRREKLEAIAAVGAQVVATGNPGCILHLAAGLRRAGSSVEVRHPVELLARAYALERTPGAGIPTPAAPASPAGPA